MSSGDWMEIIRTPAYRAVLRRLMETGTWVHPSALKDCAGSPLALENACADLVMLGEAVYQPAAGYRLARAPVVRKAVRELLADPHGEPLRMDMIQVNGGLQVGLAKRTGADPLDVVMAAFFIPRPESATPAEALNHPGQLLASLHDIELETP